ncbi:hypothetical protein [Umezawaea tangerina]|uniref:Peptidase inhibitor family I36 n=1 Tax=Umezawaea tangerina TaxID=84725 RepID=A0A2T0TK17_9PSEU|nr:hypothetical protein [Umezawaea tangerina]PRY46057.1 hypothetical protein CLV43_101321 [Umezawaea tangerina]
MRIARGLSALALAVAALALGSTAASAEADPVKLTHADAVARLAAAGVTWSSSGGCVDRDNPSCTSFEQVNLASVQGVIALKQATGCAVNVTGGTEVGHATDTFSHWNGYKLDFSLSTCLNNHITTAFAPLGGDKWQAPSGNVYFREVDHWDVVYYTCGC